MLNKCRYIFYLLVIFMFSIVIFNINHSSVENLLAVNSGIALDKETITLEVGKSEKLTYKLGSGYTNKSVVWVTNNKRVATVDGEGNVKGVGVGKAYIIVALKDNYSIRDMCEVIVKQASTPAPAPKPTPKPTPAPTPTPPSSKTIPVVMLTLNETSLNVKKGASGTLTVKVNPINATNRNVTWTSSNTKVVTVSSAGVIKAIGAGKAVITVASVSNPGVTATCSVKVVDTEANAKTGAALILKNAEKYYKKIEKDGNWVHRMDKNKYKDYDGWTECCRYVSHVLIESGYLKKGGYLCHANTNSTSTPKNAGQVINMKVIKTKKLSKLKPGDVMVRNGKKNHNIAIFAYKKNDKYYVYGASSTGEIRLKSHPAARDWWKNHKITAIVRAKS
ncbi:MAG: Ig-like domain-containing protein [Bacilli bacterium]|nr:Ig-like domain-containing protein [Bacilli bacterium]